MMIDRIVACGVLLMINRAGPNKRLSRYHALCGNVETGRNPDLHGSWLRQGLWEQA